MCVCVTSLSHVCKLKTAGGKRYKFSSASVEVLVVTMEMSVRPCCRVVEITHGVNHCSHPLVTEHTQSLHRYKLSGFPRLSHGRSFLNFSHINLCGFCGPLNGEVHWIRAVVRWGCVCVNRMTVKCLPYHLVIWPSLKMTDMMSTCIVCDFTTTTPIKPLDLPSKCCKWLHNVFCSLNKRI